MDKGDVANLRYNKLIDLAVKGVETIESLMSDDKESNILTYKDSDHRTLLHWSALKGNEELVEFLLKQKDVDIEARDDSMATPIIMAALGNHLPIIKLLVDSGANVNEHNSGRHTALEYCCSRGNIDGVNYLLNHGANRDLQDNIGNSPLHRAASLGRNKIVELLLEHPAANKANVNLQNNFGNTPLHLACEDQQNDCAITLGLAGASFLIENRDKQTPLDVCTPPLRSLLKAKFHLNEK